MKMCIESYQNHIKYYLFLSLTVIKGTQAQNLYELTKEHFNFHTIHYSYFYSIYSIYEIVIKNNVYNILNLNINGPLGQRGGGK